MIDIRHWAMWHANYIFYILDFFLMFLEHYPQYAPPHQTAQTLGSQPQPQANHPDPNPNPNSNPGASTASTYSTRHRSSRTRGRSSGAAGL